MIAAMSLHLDWRLASIACLFDCWLPVEPLDCYLDDMRGDGRAFL